MSAFTLSSTPISDFKSLLCVTLADLYDGLDLQHLQQERHADAQELRAFQLGHESTDAHIVADVQC